MRYQIKHFEFDANNLVLSHNRQPVSIRHNEALLLKLFIENTGKVLSKDEILTHIWQGKVVSEQAVFQNISHLRNIFGADAIKTYAKRGYEWQLPIQQLNEHTKQIEQIAKEATVTKSSQSVILIVSLLLMLVLVAVLNINTAPKRSMALIPFENNCEQSVNLVDVIDFNVTTINKIETNRFNATQILSYKSLSAEHPLILTGEMSKAGEGCLIDFKLVGPKGQWHGQIIADSEAAAINKLNSHLSQNVMFDWVNVPATPSVKLAMLTLAHQEHAEDLIVLHQLANTYLQSNKLDTAMSLADKLEQLAKQRHNQVQQGNALLLQSTILTRKELVELSNHKLDEAISAYAQINDHKRLADAFNAKSWLNHLDNDFGSVKHSLLTSAEHALLANDIERELHALTYLSVMAHKHKNQSDKYLYLQLAESKMKAYNLPQYHYAKVPFHYAIYADNPADKEPHLKRVLEYTELTPDHWVAQSSRKQLLDYYLDTERLALAKALVETLTNTTPQNMLLKARLALAEKDDVAFEQLGKEAFEQAQLAGSLELSLDIALLLCNDPKEQINHDFYFDYINQNATANWSKRNQTKLHALNNI
ncbi:winged helix-turn-helix domain-containing protein [Pseudoalteromonas sp. G4]|uniref:winged helix-turn-helix domain-containing protein n=1 Tax=Pseudoalteromonas sp. G4 TaxID=2992761 RepID=UPI00237E0A22|nr:winged helix-turn-helix domain-containing protein [Pseudoalteromonas sp. G4]MDE3270459.1 winged helix-turn-helix domain-containing protein [Pseudoalteromonas sp. G4]